MAQPPGYTPATDFSAEEANNQAGRSTVRTAQLDAELAALEVTLDAVLANMAVLQRDDLELRDGKVRLHTLADDVKSLLATTGCVVRGAWLTATLYQLKDIVTQGGLTYICASVHTSGVFATDLAAVRWIALNSELAVNQTFTPAAGISAGNVQAALEELGNQVGDGTNGMGRRNRLHNGAMRIDQRYAGNIHSNAASPFLADRWAIGTSGVQAVNLQTFSTDGPEGCPTFARVTVTTNNTSPAAGDVMALQQGLEGHNMADLQWGLASGRKPVSLSFYVRSSVAGAHSGAIRDSSARGYPFSFTINQANTWERKIIPNIPGDNLGSFNNGNLAWGTVSFCLLAGSNWSAAAGAWATGGTGIVGVTGSVQLIRQLGVGATFDITGVQLEAGTIATEFERSQYTTELALCQRYYWRGSVYAHNVAGNVLSYPVPMRITPTSIVTLTLNAGANATYAAINFGGSNSLSNTHFYQNTANTVVASAAIEVLGADL